MMIPPVVSSKKTTTTRRRRTTPNIIISIIKNKKKNNITTTVTTTIPLILSLICMMMTTTTTTININTGKNHHHHHKYHNNFLLVGGVGVVSSFQISYCYYSYPRQTTTTKTTKLSSSSSSSTCSSLLLSRPPACSSLVSFHHHHMSTSSSSLSSSSLSSTTTSSSSSSSTSSTLSSSSSSDDVVGATITKATSATAAGDAGSRSASSSGTVVDHKNHNNNNNNNNDDDYEYGKKNNNDVDQKNTTSSRRRSSSSTRQQQQHQQEEEEEDIATRLTACSALERLIQHQRYELEESERLLKLLLQQNNTISTTISTISATNNSSSSSSIRDSLSTAASIISGFDYGFISRSEGSTSTLRSGNVDISSALGYGGPPANIILLSIQQFIRNLYAIIGKYKDEDEEDDNQETQVTSHKQRIFRDKLKMLTLNSTEIWEREYKDGPIEAPWIIKLPYLTVCYLLDVVFDGRYVPSRFFLLETVARMPYFSYISMLHLYETIGIWRRSADMKRIHFAEELNEYNHLLIMESLGGDQEWWVRFIAQHSAVLYYFILCILWAISPTLSYRFSELLETHAVNTYGTFMDENETILKELPPSIAAIEYYSIQSTSNDPFYAEFQTSAITTTTIGNMNNNNNGQYNNNIKNIRRPGIYMRSLYDVFSAIQADEGDHVSTMNACLDPDASVQSPSIERKVLNGIALVSAISFLYTTTATTGGGGGGDIFGGISQEEIRTLLENFDFEGLWNLIREGGTTTTTMVDTASQMFDSVVAVDAATNLMKESGITESGEEVTTTTAKAVADTAEKLVGQDSIIEVGTIAMGSILNSVRRGIISFVEAIGTIIRFI